VSGASTAITTWTSGHAVTAHTAATWKTLRRLSSDQSATSLIPSIRIGDWHQEVSGPPQAGHLWPILMEFREVLRLLAGAMARGWQARTM